MSKKSRSAKKCSVEEFQLSLKLEGGEDLLMGVGEKTLNSLSICDEFELPPLSTEREVKG